MSQVCFSRWKMRPVAELASIERAQSGKTYPAGCTLYPLSASSPELVRYLPEAGPVPSRFAVLNPHDGVNRYYFFLSVQRAAPKFAHEYQTGINLQFPVLVKRLKIAYHEDRETQDFVAKSIAKIETAADLVSRQIEADKTAKRRFLQLMFVGENITRPGKS